MNKDYKVFRVTMGPKHHLFGFHDLPITNAKGDLALALEVDDIAHPPLPGESCRSGVIPLAITPDHAPTPSPFLFIHSTQTWNYPQGARQQWIGDSDLFVCNDREPDGRLVARVNDARRGRTVETLPFPVHCLNAELGRAIYLNYDRVHAVGGYGYHPQEERKSIRLEDIPDDDGLWIGDVGKGDGSLLVSLAQVAACGEKRPVRTGYPHYVTHPMLNPDGTRVAFLHRYRVADGGEPTRLMTVGIDGAGLRCLAKGFLSHFTWIGNDELFIWGKDERRLCAMREAAWLRVPGMLQSALLAKKMVRLVRGGGFVSGAKMTSEQTQGKSIANGPLSTPAQNRTFLRVRDEEDPELKAVAIGVLTGDGHPMACPGRLHWLVNDTYWDAMGDRHLMFYDLDANKRYDVGKFKMIFDKPDSSAFDVAAAQSGLDRRILKKFDRSDYLFYRSGFHCDLHPRWSSDGRTAFFDSIHEGTRQIYAVQG